MRDYYIVNPQDKTVNVPHQGLAEAYFTHLLMQYYDAQHADFNDTVLGRLLNSQLVSEAQAIRQYILIKDSACIPLLVSAFLTELDRQGVLGDKKNENFNICETAENFVFDARKINVLRCQQGEGVSFYRLVCFTKPNLTTQGGVLSTFKLEQLSLPDSIALVAGAEDPPPAFVDFERERSSSVSPELPPPPSPAPITNGRATLPPPPPQSKRPLELATKFAAPASKTLYRVTPKGLKNEGDGFIESYAAFLVARCLGLGGVKDEKPLIALTSKLSSLSLLPVELSTFYRDLKAQKGRDTYIVRVAGFLRTLRDKSPGDFLADPSIGSPVSALGRPQFQSFAQVAVSSTSGALSFDVFKETILSRGYVRGKDFEKIVLQEDQSYSLQLALDGDPSDEMKEILDFSLAPAISVVAQALSPEEAEEAEEAEAAEAVQAAQAEPIASPSPEPAQPAVLSSLSVSVELQEQEGFFAVVPHVERQGDGFVEALAAALALAPCWDKGELAQLVFSQATSVQNANAVFTILNNVRTLDTRGSKNDPKQILIFSDLVRCLRDKAVSPEKLKQHIRIVKPEDIQKKDFVLHDREFVFVNKGSDAEPQYFLCIARQAKEFFSSSRVYTGLREFQFSSIRSAVVAAAPEAEELVELAIEKDVSFFRTVAMAMALWQKSVDQLPQGTKIPLAYVALAGKLPDFLGVEDLAKTLNQGPENIYKRIKGKVDELKEQSKYKNHSFEFILVYALGGAESIFSFMVPGSQGFDSSKAINMVCREGRFFVVLPKSTCDASHSAWRFDSFQYQGLRGSVMPPWVEKLSSPPPVIAVPAPAVKSEIVVALPAQVPLSPAPETGPSAEPPEPVVPLALSDGDSDDDDDEKYEDEGGENCDTNQGGGPAVPAPQVPAGIKGNVPVSGPVSEPAPAPVPTLAPEPIEVFQELTPEKYIEALRVIKGKSEDEQKALFSYENAKNEKVNASSVKIEVPDLAQDENAKTIAGDSKITVAYEDKKEVVIEHETYADGKSGVKATGGQPSDDKAALIKQYLEVAASLLAVIKTSQSGKTRFIFDLSKSEEPKHSNLTRTELEKALEDFCEQQNVYGVKLWSGFRKNNKFKADVKVDVKPGAGKENASANPAGVFGKFSAARSAAGLPPSPSG